MIDATILELSRSKHEYAQMASTIEGEPGALLFVTFFADTPDEAGAQLDRLQAAWREHGHGYHFLRAETAAEQDALTKVRKAGLGLLMAASEGAKRPAAFVEDTAVAPERLGDYVKAFRAILDRHGLTAGFYGHCSVGCLHIRPFVDLTAPGGVDTMAAVADEIAALVAEFDGVNSSEHGDGRVRSPFNPRVFGDDLYAAMRKVKALFDPDGRFNPGVMVDAAAADHQPPRPGAAARAAAADPLLLRRAAGCATPPTAASASAPAARPAQGVMCPSYMATREEEHATRGRANALVKALSEPDPRAALGDERLHEILDLCLECKACKSECPLSVDMATMKSEFLSHYQAQHGTPLRSRLFGAIRRLNRARRRHRAALQPARCRAGCSSAWRASTAGGRSRASPARRCCAGTASDARRARRRAATSSSSPTRSPPSPSPRIGRAAIELLEAAGWNVRLESAGCCGRSSISKGLLDQAQGMAEAMVARLAPEAERGVPIVGCEPSCLLTLREEHPGLLAGDPRAQTRRRRRRGSSRSCSSRRSTTARCALDPSADGQRTARSSSTATATRRRWPARPPPSRCSSASRARR